MPPLYQTYRPTCLDQVLGQPKAVKVASLMINRGLGGQAIWITGPSGSGKTTIAEIMAAHHSPNRLNWSEFVGPDVRVSDLRDLAQGYWAHKPLDGSGYVCIVNEAHALRSDVIAYLLDLLEKLPQTVLVIFTTTGDGQASLLECKQDAARMIEHDLQGWIANAPTTPYIAADIARKAARRERGDSVASRRRIALWTWLADIPGGEERENASDEEEYEND
jgi:DNA polymerase III delta prime subunit